MEFYRLSDATFYDRINTIYQFIKHVLDKKNVSIFQEYGAFNVPQDIYACLNQPVLS